MRGINKLTPRKIAATQKPGRYADRLGLYLEIRRAVNKSWSFRYMVAGRARELGLGSLPVSALPRLAIGRVRLASFC